MKPEGVGGGGGGGGTERRPDPGGQTGTQREGEGERACVIL